MVEKKDKLLSKFVRKDYNNELEEVLSKKNYKEDVKSLILSMCYKIESAYKDYETVKKGVLSKEEYIEKIIYVIQKECNSIEFINRNQEQEINRKDKLIKCYPIEINLLYSLSGIKKKDTIIKNNNEYVQIALTDMLNEGNNINTCEPLRDFNGFSWNVVAKDIYNLVYNLVYQDLIILNGNNFLENWINNNKFILDYFEVLENKLTEDYGKKIKDNLITDIIKISLLEKMILDKNFEENIEKEKIKVEKKYDKFKDSEKYILEITNKKKRISKKIKKIDQTINDKELLLEEYEKRNSKLPLEEKIFSMKVLKKIMQDERSELVKKLEEYSKKINPHFFIQKQTELRKSVEYFSIVEEKSKLEMLRKYIIDLQKEILNVFNIKIDKLEEKAEIIKLIYSFRYYLNLPVTNEKNILKIDIIKEDIKKIYTKLINKAIQKKVILDISDNEKIQSEIYKNIFVSKIISLEKVSIKVFKEKNEQNFKIQFFEEEIMEKQIESKNILDKNDLKIKLNKKIKLFI